ncbi:MAG: SprT-like domain-containing protein, partial [bacterium]
MAWRRYQQDRCPLSAGHGRGSFQMFEVHSEIMNAWIRQLRLDWRNANYCYFGGRMSPPCIDLIHSEKVMGKWEGGMKRKLSISSLFMRRYPWQYVQEVLYHEMAHQYVEEILKITEESSHGKTFKNICREKGFDYRATGDMSGWIDHKRQPIT